MVGRFGEPGRPEKEYLTAPSRDLPTHDRLTGRGNTAGIEMVLSMQSDLTLDIGSVDATYASRADRVQKQTGIPYVLIDGSLAGMPEMLREVGCVDVAVAGGETAGRNTFVPSLQPGRTP